MSIAIHEWKCERKPIIGINRQKRGLSKIKKKNKIKYRHKTFNILRHFESIKIICYNVYANI